MGTAAFGVIAALKLSCKFSWINDGLSRGLLNGVRASLRRAFKNCRGAYFYLCQRRDVIGSAC